VDLVTETDQAVEDMVKKTLSDKYPHHKYFHEPQFSDVRFIGEETYSAGQESILDESPTWIVDPIDGIFFHN
jgi:myo-inositol-1(or 4)-monophosphatase